MDTQISSIMPRNSEQLKLAGYNAFVRKSWLETPCAAALLTQQEKLQYERILNFEYL